MSGIRCAVFGFAPWLRLRVLSRWIWARAESKFDSILGFRVADSIHRTSIQRAGLAWVSVETVPGEPQNSPPCPSREPQDSASPLSEPISRTTLRLLPPFGPICWLPQLRLPAGPGSAAIRRTMLPKSRRVRRALRTVKEYPETAEYIPMNPVRRGLVKRAEEWKSPSVREQVGVDADEPDSQCGLPARLPQAGRKIDPAWRDLSQHKALSLRLRYWISEFFCRINPQADGFVYILERCFVTSAVGHAAGQFRDFSDKHPVLGAPVDDDFVFVHRLMVLLPVHTSG